MKIIDRILKAACDFYDQLPTVSLARYELLRSSLDECCHEMGEITIELADAYEEIDRLRAHAEKLEAQLADARRALGDA